MPLTLASLIILPVYRLSSPKKTFLTPFFLYILEIKGKQTWQGQNVAIWVFTLQTVVLNIMESL
jgi:hypothetical protein